MAKSSGGNGLVVEVDLATELLRAKSNEVDQVFALMDQNAFNMGERIGVAMQKVADRFGVFAGLSQDQVDKVQASGEDIAKTYDKLAERIAKARVAGNDNDDGGLAQMREQIEVQRQKIAFADQVIAKANAMRAAEGQLVSQIEQSVAAWNASRNASALRMKQLELEVGALERMGIAEMAASRGHVDHAANAQRNAAAMQQLTYQINDVATGLGSGTPVMQIFAQQSSQVIQAIQLMKLEGESFLGLMGGQWPMLMIAGASVLLPVIANLDIFKDKLGDAVKKLKEQADETENSAAAQRIFDVTLQGAIIKQRQMNTELEKELKTRRQINQEKANAAGENVATLAKKLQEARDDPELKSHNISERVAARERLRDVQTAYYDALADQRRADIPNLKLQAAALADPKEAARQKSEAQGSLLARQYVLGNLGPDEFIKQQAELDRQLAASKKTGTSSETLAKRAEAARLKQLGEDTAYSEAERAARHKLFEAMGKTAASEDQRNALLLDDINAEAAAAKRKIANELSAKKINAAEAQHLVDLAEQTRLQRITNADLARTSDDVRDAANADLRTLDAKIAMAKIEADMAKTAQARRAAQLKLLDLEEQKVKAEAQKVLADPLSSQSDRQAANDRITQTDAAHPVKVEQINRATQDLGNSLQGVGQRGFKTLEEGFAGVVSNSTNAAQAVNRAITSIIADLARLAFQKGIMALLGGTGIGSFLGLSSGGKVPAYAGGGKISGAGTGTSDSILALVGGTNPILVSNGESIMNARATAQYWPILNAMNKGQLPRFASGGLVASRVPSLAGLSRMGASSANVTFDLRGAVMTEDILRQMNAIAASNAAVSVAVAPSIAQREMADLANRRIP